MRWPIDWFRPSSMWLPIFASTSSRGLGSVRIRRSASKRWRNGPSLLRETPPRVGLACDSSRRCRVSSKISRARVSLSRESIALSCISASKVRRTRRIRRRMRTSSPFTTSSRSRAMFARLSLVRETGIVSRGAARGRLHGETSDCTRAAQWRRRRTTTTTASEETRVLGGRAGVLRPTKEDDWPGEDTDRLGGIAEVAYAWPRRARTQSSRCVQHQAHQAPIAGVTRARFGARVSARRVPDGDD